MPKSKAPKMDDLDYSKWGYFRFFAHNIVAKRS